MMRFTEEFKALALTVRLNGLCEKSKMIGDRIGGLPIIFFPEQHKELIELAEEEYELAIELYQIHLENQEFNRAAAMLKAEEVIEMSLFYLKKDLKVA